ncbi:hypothetical protein OpiT1DRAFT_02217 [Opitutaceae bacterium TAV1]|nr:hypothetical protein OpiT1DRAFT_02217 [Opitutaceae bacterium TAV1]
MTSPATSFIQPPSLSPVALGQLRAWLTAEETNYTPGLRMVRSVWAGPGYHSRVPNGTLVHETRHALSYALLLLAEGSAASVARAADVIAATLPLQETDPCAPTYGIWPWLQEEPLSDMRPPDWNWADFCGVRLAHILACYHAPLTAQAASGPALVAAIEAALGHAARSIFRRNVGPGYTNIAVKGAVVCAAAGELLGDPFLLHYGRTRLARIIAYSRHHEGFNEYNSPNYGHLVLTELERGLLLIRDPEVRAHLQELHAFTWRQFATTFHPGTGQLCGPQSRAYQDLLPDAFARILEAEVGITVFRPANHPAAQRRDFAAGDPVAELLIPRHPAPADVRDTIEQAAREPVLRRQFFVRSPREAENRVSTVWHSPATCIGSMNTGTFWVQQRPVLGYWRAGDAGDAVAVLRVRFTHDGRDFASGMLQARQHDNTLLALATLVTDKGDFHDHLDRPADGVFDVSQLALSIELTAPDATVTDDAASPGGFVLAAGKTCVRLRPAFGVFGDLPVIWETGASASAASGDVTVTVRALVNRGERFRLIPAALDAVGIGFCLELVPRDEVPSRLAVTATRPGNGDTLHLSAIRADRETSALEIVSSLKPGPYPAFRG